MTNTTNESEAMEVWRMAKQARHLAFYPYDGTKSKQEADQAAARVIATALEERDAQLKTVLDREADTIRRYDAKLDERDARIAELEGALEPFAKVGDLAHNSHITCFVYTDHCRKARTILTKGNTHD